MTNFNYAYGLTANVRSFIERSGAGNEGCHVIATNDVPYVAGEDEFAFAIQCYTDGATFDELEEGDNVYESADADVTADDLRLDAGGSGYPQMVVIPGRFTKVVPTAGSIVALFVINPIR